MSKQKQFTHGSLFSGIGGPEVAAAMLGWQNAFHCEINPFGRQVLEYWFPDSVSYEDITKTDFSQWRGKIDVLTGGFPCQPFSYAGKRGGQKDERYLWPQMCRAISEIRPTWVVGENVAGITTMVEGGVLTEVGSQASLFEEGNELHGYELEQSFTIERICSDLERIGYNVQPMLIPAAAVGAPHRRDRIFIIARLATDSTGSGCPAQGESGSLEGGRSEGHVFSSERRQQAEWSDGLHPVQGTPSDSDSGSDVRISGEYEGEGRAQGLQERNEVQLAGESDKLRSEIQGTIENTHYLRCSYGEYDQQGNQRNIGNAGAGDSERLRGETRSDSSDANGRGSGEVPSSVHSRLSDGNEPQRNGSIGDVAHANSERLQASVQSGCYGSQEWYDAERPVEYAADDAWSEGAWWNHFPTVSPVHSGNDGLPIRLDGISLPASMQPRNYRNSDSQRFNFGKWRTESIKAYGNAIVPQVMYRIFQAIEEITNGSSN